MPSLTRLRSPGWVVPPSFSGQECSLAQHCPMPFHRSYGSPPRSPGHRVVKDTLGADLTTCTQVGCFRGIYVSKLRLRTPARSNMQRIALSCLCGFTSKKCIPALQVHFLCRTDTGKDSSDTYLHLISDNCIENDIVRTISTLSGGVGTIAVK